MVEYQNWVHGCDINISVEQDPENTVDIYRSGEGSAVHGEDFKKQSFYFAIPTPTGISSDESIEIEEVYVQLELFMASTLNRITVHDGNTEIFADDLDIKAAGEGDQTPTELDLTFDLDDRKINSGVCLGLEITFGKSLFESEGKVWEGGIPHALFIAAGAQFDTFTLPIQRPPLHETEGGQQS